MGRKKQPPKDDKEQSARFIETAEQVEIDEEGFKKACKVILNPKDREKTKAEPEGE